MHRDHQHYGRACQQIPHDLHDAVAEIWDESSGYREAGVPLCFASYGTSTSVSEPVS